MADVHMCWVMHISVWAYVLCTLLCYVVILYSSPPHPSPPPLHILLSSPPHPSPLPSTSFPLPSPILHPSHPHPSPLPFISFSPLLPILLPSTSFTSPFPSLGPTGEFHHFPDHDTQTGEDLKEIGVSTFGA